MELNITFWIFAFIFGLVVGSFINVVVWRLPREQSIIYPSSHCPKCKNPIAWYDNIPIISFLLLKGRCRHCGERISLRYPVIELISGFLSIICWWCFGMSVWFFVYYAFLCALFIASVIDLEHRLIPDEISISGAVIGVGLAFIPNSKITPLNAIIGAGAGFLVIFLVAELYYIFTKREGMGLGDAKLLAMIGAFLGWRSLWLVIFLGSLLGIIFGLVAILMKGEGRFYKIPFGPFLALGTFVSLYLSERFFALLGGS